jgi:hypothetical protein
MSSKTQVEWRRAKVLEMISKGNSQTEIASFGKDSLDWRIKYAIEEVKRVGTNIQFLDIEVREKL